ncbi:MAG: hypothetical protein WBB79_10690 [Candidatus Macondimonas sp.]|jgi:hypothetical protein
MVKTHYLITFDPSAGPHFPDAASIYDKRQALRFKPAPAISSL